MFVILNLSIKLYLTEKLSALPFKNTSIDSLDILLRQNVVRKLTFSLSALSLKISFPLTRK